MHFDHSRLPPLKMLFQDLLIQMNARDDRDPRQADSMDHPNDQAVSNATPAAAGSFESVQLVMIMFIVQHRNPTNQANQNGEWQDGPVKAHDGRQRTTVNFPHIRGESAASSRDRWLFRLIQNPRSAGQCPDPHGIPGVLHSLHIQRHAFVDHTRAGEAEDVLS